MRSPALLSFALLAACSGSAPDQPAFPEIWGFDAAVDYDVDPDVVEVHLMAGAETVMIDGQPSQMFAYNDIVPGPGIQAKVGDTIRVEFFNNLNQPSTIHWHGLRIDNAMDGVPAVQDPVQPGETFTYEFVVPDSGTFWYHPHVRGHEQVERGLQGKIVIHDETPLAYDKERFFVLDDILLDGNGRLDTAFDPVGGMTAMHGRLGNTLLINGDTAVREDTVVAGQRERWRIVNTANARTLWIDVENAEWQIIAIDGNLLQQPRRGQGRLRLPIGRRFDLEVIPTGDAELQVELPNSDGGWDEYPAFVGAYTGDAPAPGFLQTVGPRQRDILDQTQELSLELGAVSGQYGVEYVINGLHYGEGDAIPLDADTPSKITVVETTGLEHPFHLHGQFFRVLSRSGAADIVPGELDTLLIDGGETVELYTEFRNPGRWMAHCHILEHAETGMMTEFDVR